MIPPEPRPFSRRSLLASASASLWAVGCGRKHVSLVERVNRASVAATRWMVAAQAPDGSWSSRSYGALKDGLSLTPAVLKAVVFGPTVGGSEEARRRGATYLAARVQSDGSIDAGPYGLIYPVYSAATAAIVLSRVIVPGSERARDGWLREVRARQLDESLGWEPADLAFGGWGYSVQPPVRSELDRASGSLIDADISSTLFAIGALRMTGMAAEAPTIRKALIFASRCQNFVQDGESGDPAYDDGGFFFSPTDPVRNKAGVAGNDQHGRERYYSYGSATADGLRILLRCGLDPAHPRIAAARGWLERHFSSEHNPGRFEPLREVERDATYFYYCWSVAHAFRSLGIRVLSHGGRKVDWTEVMSRALMREQGPDGSWSNRFRASKEDDPLIATPLAAGALGVCSMVMSSST